MAVLTRRRKEAAAEVEQKRDHSGTVTSEHPRAHPEASKPVKEEDPVNCVPCREFLQDWHEVPQYYQDNRFIRTGYRVAWGWEASLRSFWGLHNESGNIWTHLAGFLMIIFTMVFGFWSISTHGLDYFVHEHHLEPFNATNATHSPHLFSEKHEVHLDIFDTDMDVFQYIAENGFGAAAQQYMTSKSAQLTEFVSINVEQRLHYFNEVVAYSRAVASEDAEVAMAKLRNIRLHLIDDLHRIMHSNDTLHEALEVGKEEFTHAAQQGMELIYTMSHHIMHDLEFSSVVPTTPGVSTHLKQLETWPITVYLISGALCCLCSCIFHLFSSVSIKVSEQFRSLDYAGICILIGGSNIPISYYGFYCNPTAQTIHLSLEFLLSFVSFAIVMSPCVDGIRSLRTWTFIILGFYCVIPVTHMTLLIRHWEIIYSLLFMGMFYIGGAMIYLFHIPERFFAPGRFDLCGHSHQWWHILVVVGIFAHYQGILAFYLWRMNTTCEEQAGFGW